MWIGLPKMIVDLCNFMLFQTLCCIQLSEVTIVKGYIFECSLTCGGKGALTMRGTSLSLLNLPNVSIKILVKIL